MPKQFATFAADKLRWSTRMPASDMYTVMFWAKPNSIAAGYKPYFYRCNNSAPPYLFLGLNGAAVLLDNSMDPTTYAGNVGNGSTLTTGVWRHWTLVVTDPSASFYLDGVLDATSSRTGAFTVSNDHLAFGNNNDTDAESGVCSICAVKVWSGIPMGPDQIVEERNFAFAVNRDNLWFEAPLIDGNNPYCTDGQVWDTFAGTITDPDMPSGLIWNYPERRVYVKAAAASAFQPAWARSSNQFLGTGAWTC